MVDLEKDVVETLGIDSKASGSKKRKIWLVVAILVVVGVGALVVMGKLRRAAPEKIEFQTQTVNRGGFEVIVSATGTLEPTNEVEVGSELSGTIKSVEVDFNDRVKAGQILVRLDTTKLKAELAQSKASLEVAKANVLEAKATIKEAQSKLAQLKKVWELSDHKVPSLTEIDAAEATFERANANAASVRAKVSQARAAVEAIETDLSKAVIRSPINGIVLSRNIDPGQTVAASYETPVLLTLAEDLTKMELHVDVDEADVGKVQKDQEATFSVDAYPERTFKARIIKVHYASDTTEGVVTYETILEVSNSDLSLRPGMTATTDIVVKRVENAILVPNAALRFTPPVGEKRKAPPTGLVSMLLPGPPRRRDAKPPESVTNNKKHEQVWILKNEMPLPVPVATGATDGNMTEILDGSLKPGMKVVIDAVSAKP